MLELNIKDESFWLYTKQNPTIIVRKLIWEIEITNLFYFFS